MTLFFVESIIYFFNVESETAIALLYVYGIAFYILTPLFIIMIFCDKVLDKGRKVK